MHRTAVVDWLESRQIWLYVAAIVLGGLCGVVLPDTTVGASSAINPLLAALLYVTFLQVPVSSLFSMAGRLRFVVTLLAINFVVVPIVVGGLMLAAPEDSGIRVGILLVLLCPCIDYVVVFTGLAGGDAARLLAATPILLVVQFLLLPAYLAVFGAEAVDGALLDVGPFVEAFAFIIVLPLFAAWCTQLLRPRSVLVRRVALNSTSGMVPLMIVTLVVVAASQVPQIRGMETTVLSTVPVFVVFAVVMVLVGAVIGRFAGLGVGARRAVAMSGATRNSLVVMPLALALPADLAAAPAVVVTQTLVEVLFLALCIRLLPWLIRAPGAPIPLTE